MAIMEFEHPSEAWSAGFVAGLSGESDDHIVDWPGHYADGYRAGREAGGGTAFHVGDIVQVRYDSGAPKRWLGRFLTVDTLGIGGLALVGPRGGGLCLSPRQVLLTHTLQRDSKALAL